MPLPTVILPGYLADAAEYRSLETDLNAEYGLTVTVPVRWYDWIATIGRSVTGILNQLDATIHQVRQQSGSSHVNLIGHSAGGWLARIYLGDRPYCLSPRMAPVTWNGRSQVATLITLGTPHTSLERWTRRNLEFVNHTYPGAFYAQDLPYICVAGKAVLGDRRQQWFAYNSYKMTCGSGDCWGDGITPIASAHLEGATNLTLEGATHAPKGDRRWYGSPEFREAWIPYLH